MQFKVEHVKGSYPPQILTEAQYLRRMSRSKNWVLVDRLPDEETETEATVPAVVAKNMGDKKGDTKQEKDPTATKV